jgi:SAM-dependent methyltransferase
MSAATYQLYRIGRRISQTSLAKRLIPTRLKSVVQARLLMQSIDLMPDRRYFEAVLLPTMVAMRPDRILDIGVESYSARYREAFPETSEYWTLDLNPAVASLGTPGRHIVGNALNLASYFPAKFFDLIILNGVFGFGINSVPEQEQAMEAAAGALKHDGWLLLGWDKAQGGSPVMSADNHAPASLLDLSKLKAARRLYLHEAPFALSPRATFDECSHIYDWFRRRKLPEVQSHA